MTADGSIRLATYEDSGHAQRLWGEYLKESHDSWGSFPPTTKNLWAFKDLFTAYTRGNLFGVCAIWETPEGAPAGISVAGETVESSPFESDRGRVAHVWGVYIEKPYRKHGRSLEMLLWGAPRLLDMGFVIAQTSTQAGNRAAEQLAHAHGSKPVETIWNFDLKAVR